MIELSDGFFCTILWLSHSLPTMDLAPFLTRNICAFLILLISNSNSKDVPTIMSRGFLLKSTYFRVWGVGAQIARQDSVSFAIRHGRLLWLWIQSQSLMSTFLFILPFMVKGASPTPSMPSISLSVRSSPSLSIDSSFLTQFTHHGSVFVCYFFIAFLRLTLWILDRCR